MNKKSGSSCEYNLTTSRNKINKCLTAGVKWAFGCLPPRIETLYLHIPETVNGGRMKEEDKQGHL